MADSLHCQQLRIVQEARSGFEEDGPPPSYDDATGSATAKAEANELEAIAKCRERSKSIWIHFPHVELLFLFYAVQGSLAAQVAVLREDDGVLFYVAAVALVSARWDVVDLSPRNIERGRHGAGEKDLGRPPTVIGRKKRGPLCSANHRISEKTLKNGDEEWIRSAGRDPSGHKPHDVPEFNWCHGVRMVTFSRRRLLLGEALQAPADLGLSLATLPLGNDVFVHPFLFRFACPLILPGSLGQLFFHDDA